MGLVGPIGPGGAGLGANKKTYLLNGPNSGNKYRPTAQVRA